MKKGARRRSPASHELTPDERARGGRTRQANRWKAWYRDRWQELRELLDEREEELARVRRSIEAAQAHAPEPAPPSWQRPPAQPADVPEPEQPADAPQPLSRLSVAEQDALDRGLTGPCWWQDDEVLDARREARRRARFVHV
jgi:hypothetical protein